MKVPLRFFFCLCVVALSACSKRDSSHQFRIAFVTSSSEDYWAIARKGCEKADEELSDVQVEFRVADDGTAAGQKRIVDDLLSHGIAALAITPVDPPRQVSLINETARHALVMTGDNDIPESDRVFYLGTDNRAAGAQAGDLIKKALPTGGQIVVLAGRLEAAYAQARYQGFREALAGSNVEIVDVRTNDADPRQVKTDTREALVHHSQIAALVGLWNDSGSPILSAVRDAGKAGKVKIICFGEDDQTLAGVKSGAISATVVQQPYEFGYRAVQMMAHVLNGDRSVIPASKQQFIPTLVVDQANVDEFTQKLDQLRGRA